MTDGISRTPRTLAAASFRPLPLTPKAWSVVFPWCFSGASQPYGAATTNIALDVFQNGRIVGQFTNQNVGQELNNPLVVVTLAASASLAGVAAMILAADPNLIPAQVEQIMQETALPMHNSAVSGAGLVQVDPAVATAEALLAQPDMSEYVSVANATVAAGGSVAVDAYAMNLGNGVAGASNAGIYLSNSPTITTSDAGDRELRHAGDHLPARILRRAHNFGGVTRQPCARHLLYRRDCRLHRSAQREQRNQPHLQRGKDHGDGGRSPTNSVVNLGIPGRDEPDFSYDHKLITRPTVCKFLRWGFVCI